MISVKDSVLFNKYTMSALSHILWIIIHVLVPDLEVLCQAYYVASTSSSESEIQWILKQQVEPQCCHHHYMSAACIGTTALLLSALLLYLIALLAMVSQVHHYHVMLHAHPFLRCWQQTSVLSGTVYGRSSNTMLSILSSTLPSSPPISSILIPLIGFWCTK